MDVHITNWGRKKSNKKLEFLVFCPTVFSCLNTFLSSLMPVYLHTSIKYHVHGLSHFSRVWLFATLWTVDCQAPLSMEFFRQEYWDGLPCPPPGDLPKPGTEPMSPTLAGRFFTTSATTKISFIENCLIECKHTHTCLYWNFKHRCSYLCDALARRVTGGPAYFWIPEVTDM